jgi:TPP-dependent pyruvate/acetoin dehydrogenase alpha subunit
LKKETNNSKLIDKKELLTKMLLIRQVEETLAEAYADQEMRCPVHLSIGQEASAVGVCQALQKSDQIFSTHRSHAHYIAKGGDLNAMIAEIYGKSTGCIGGRGGSMHLMDKLNGIVASVPIVASSIPLAVGASLVDKIDRRDRVSVAFFGDASIEEGIFHECANFASLHKLPILFVCENNLYSVYTPLHKRQPDRPLTNLASAHDIKTLHVDGNDVVRVYEASLIALEFCRNGRGPFFLQLDSYRWREHCGPNFDNHLGYRPEEEFLKWQKLDPITKLIDNIDCNSLTEYDVKNLKEKLQKQINDGIQFAKSSPLPSPHEASQFVYAENNNDH